LTLTAGEQADRQPDHPDRRRLAGLAQQRFQPHLTRVALQFREQDSVRLPQ
jgi:hypothetical protein